MAKVESNDIKRSLKVTIGKNTYDIQLPNTGLLIDIERRKAEISGERQSAMLKGSLFTQHAYMAVECAATIETLIPEIFNDLTVDSLTKLDPFQFEELLIVYREQIFPWLLSIYKALSAKKVKEKMMAINNDPVQDSV